MRYNLLREESLIIKIDPEKIANLLFILLIRPIIKILAKELPEDIEERLFPFIESLFS